MLENDINDRYETLDRREGDIKPRHAEGDEGPSFLLIEPEYRAHDNDMSDQRQQGGKFEQGPGDGIVVIKVLIDRQEEQTHVRPENIEGCQQVRPGRDAAHGRNTEADARASAGRDQGQGIGGHAPRQRYQDVCLPARQSGRYPAAGQEQNVIEEKHGGQRNRPFLRPHGAQGGKECSDEICETVCPNSFDKQENGGEIKKRRHEFGAGYDVGYGFRLDGMHAEQQRPE